MGVNVDRTAIITFALGTALACAAGVLLAPSLYLYPTVGEILVAKCFVIVVLRRPGFCSGSDCRRIVIRCGRIPRSRLCLGSLQGCHWIRDFFTRLIIQAFRTVWSW